MSDNISLVPWKSIRENVTKTNFIGGILKGIKGADDLNIILAKYPYGDYVINKGEFCINLDNENIGYNNPKFPKALKKEFDYYWRSIPCGIVAKNSLESHINHSTHIVPFRLQPEGMSLSLLNIFDKQAYSDFVTALYSTTSGCRSLILLPKMAHKESLERMKRKLKIENQITPNGFLNQWEFFKSIVKGLNFKTDWKAEIVLFPKKFMQLIEDDPNIKYQLLHTMWNYTSYRRNILTHDFIWSIFLETLPASLKHDVRIIQAVKHLILVAMQEMPGYSPAYTNIPAPITELTKVFIEDYRIRFNLPIFMQLAIYDAIHPIYYSIQNHTYFHEIPSTSNSIQTINELDKIQKVLTKYKNYILNKNLEHSLDGTRIKKTIEETEFDFYHPKGKNKIKTDIEKMLKEDKRFLNLPYEAIINRTLSLPTHSLFFHGCIRIRKSNKYSNS